MAIQRFLGMTEAEMGGISEWPEHIAWMGCHFSPETGEICGLPEFSLPGGMLVLEDKVPFLGGDIGTLCGQMAIAAGTISCEALLLDFQRSPDPEARALAKALAASLPCPVILPQWLAADLAGPVLLPPVPLDMPLVKYLAPWKEREVWLELALDGFTVTLTEAGAAYAYLSHATSYPQAHREERLHCRYHIETTPDAVCFTLWRTREDVEELVREAEGLGVVGCVGLWQEFG